MRLARFLHNGEARWGIVQGDEVHLALGSVYDDSLSVGPAVGTLDTLKLLAPCEPTKIIGAAQNYHRDLMAAEGRLPPVPRFFLKPPTTLAGPYDDVVYPAMSQRVIHEAELAVVIKRKAKNVPTERAADYILGYTVCNDITAVDCMHVDGIPDRAKGFDTFTPMGPVLLTEFPWQDAMITCRVNQEIRQQASTREMIFGVFEYVSFVSQVMTLLPGDAILTGSPSGMSAMHPGDVVEVSIEGLGTIRNRLVRPSD